jgi:2-polyprenyl-3-methyl-5-hydroxy-6-metoxy-1,4-benzoquinol methylase
MTLNDEKISIGNIPFVYMLLDSSNNPGNIPNSMPFSLEIRNGVISQQKSMITDRALKEAYSSGSTISGQMDDFGNGKEYADEFLSYIEKNACDIKGKKILEIGCGTGYLLSCLKEMGGHCLGIEPGESAEYGRKKFGVEIIRGFFGKEIFKEKFDYIIFYCVLEHIDEIEIFLNDVKSILNCDGTVLIAVPNCTDQIFSGDISMLLSEHWSYFTEESLKFLLNQNNLFGDITVSDSGGVLLACLKVDKKKVLSRREIVEIQEMTKAEFVQYAVKFIEQKKKIIKYFKEAADRNERIGIYVPGRFINWLNVIMDINSLYRECIRFIDDNKLLCGMYYPGYDNKIENLEQFLSNPTERLLISTYTYEKAIRKKILDSGYSGNIMSIRELLQ